MKQLTNFERNKLRLYRETFGPMNSATALNCAITEEVIRLNAHKQGVTVDDLYFANQQRSYLNYAELLEKEENWIRGSAA
jgi:hypothetical protein